MQDSIPPPNSRLIRQWVFSVVFVFSLIGFSFWSVADRVPDVRIPTPKMPSPNAYTVYLQASDLIKDDRKISAAGPRFGPFASLKSPAHSLAEKEALLAENAPALKMFRDGAAYEYRNPPIRSVDAPDTYYEKLSKLLRLVLLEAQTKADKGDRAGAMEIDLEALRVAEDIARGAPITGSQASVALKNRVVVHMTRMFPHLTSAQSHALLPRLEAVRARHVPWADTLQEEKWTIQASLLEVFRKPQWREELIFMGRYWQGGPSSASATQVMFVSRARIFNDYTRYMDQCIVATRQNSANRQPLPPVPSDPFNQGIASKLLHAQVQESASETMLELLTLRMAIHAYKMDHGRLPDSLTQLVPSYLVTLPGASSGASGSITYWRTRQGYSVSKQIATPLGASNYYGYNGN